MTKRTKNPLPGLVLSEAVAMLESVGHLPDHLKSRLAGHLTTYTPAQLRKLRKAMGPHEPHEPSDIAGVLAILEGHANQ